MKENITAAIGKINHIDLGGIKSIEAHGSNTYRIEAIEGVRFVNECYLWNAIAFAERARITLDEACRWFSNTDEMLMRKEAEQR